MGFLFFTLGAVTGWSWLVLWKVWRRRRSRRAFRSAMRADLLIKALTHINQKTNIELDRLTVRQSGAGFEVFPNESSFPVAVFAADIQSDTVRVDCLEDPPQVHIKRDYVL